MTHISVSADSTPEHNEVPDNSVQTSVSGEKTGSEIPTARAAVQPPSALTQAQSAPKTKVLPGVRSNQSSRPGPTMRIVPKSKLIPFSMKTPIQLRAGKSTFRAARSAPIKSARSGPLPTTRSVPVAAKQSTFRRQLDKYRRK